MFGRHVIMKLKADSAAELTRINESEIIPLLLRFEFAHSTIHSAIAQRVHERKIY